MVGYCTFSQRETWQPELESYNEDVTLRLEKTPGSSVTHLIQNLQEISYGFILLGPQPHELLGRTFPSSHVHFNASHFQLTGKDVCSYEESNGDEDPINK